MNFGPDSVFGLGIFVLFYGVALGLIVWFIRTVTSIARSLRDIADRLATLERAVRDTSEQRRM